MTSALLRSTLAIAVATAMGLGLAACDRSAEVPTAATAAAAAPTAEQVKAESARLNAWFDAQYEEQLQFSPIQLSFLGRKDRNDQLDDMSEAGERRKEAWLAASVKAMEAGFDHFIRKPMTKAMLMVLLEQAIPADSMQPATRPEAPAEFISI